MTSAINTSSLDSNYPSPGVNNSSQGFRDNFTNIKNNLETAKTELGDLQSKVLVKSALTGTSMDNDMNNGVIANVQTLSFRASTYNLGTNLSGTVTVDCTLGDVQYGTIATSGTGANAIDLKFTKWPPTVNPIYSRIEVILTVVAGQTISLPSNVSLGLDTIEGRASSVITVPYDVTRLHYLFSSIDCGTTVEIQPIDRPRQTAQIVQRTVNSPKGFKGDKAGDITADANYLYICTASYDSIETTGTVQSTTDTGNIVTLSTGTYYSGDVLVFTGTPTTNSNLSTNTVYYISTVSGVNVTLTTTSGGSQVDVGTGTKDSNPDITFNFTAYHGSNIWKRTSLNSF